MNDSKLKKRPSLDETPVDGMSPRLDPWTWHPQVPKHLLGYVYNSASFPDGQLITTSRVQEHGPAWAQTLNTFYILGTLDNSL